MDNYAHLLLQEREEDIANIMKRIMLAMSFTIIKNIKRVGIYFRIDTKVKKIEDAALEDSLDRELVLGMFSEDENEAKKNLSNSQNGRRR